MEHLENIRLSLDEIGDALKRLSSGGKEESQSLENFHSKIAAFFPHIHYESNDALWADDEEEVEEAFIPLWWDDLDEPFELEELHWLSKIQKYELLKPEEVRVTMESIEAGIFAEAALSGELDFDIDKYGREKVFKVAEIGQEAFDYMLVHNLKLALHIARKYARKVGLEDAFQYAFFGLMQAVRKFDWRLGHQFSTYATWWLRQSLTREIADNESTIRLPVYVVDRINNYKRELREYEENLYTTAGEVTVRNKLGEFIRVEPPLPVLKLEIDIDETFRYGLETTIESLEFWDTFHQAPWLLSKYDLPDESVSSIEFATTSRDLLERLTQFVLSEQQVEILKMRNGYASTEPITLDEIGKMYGVTRERIRQIEAKALTRVFEFLKGVDLRNYWDVIEDVSERFQEKEANSPEVIATRKRNEKAKRDAERKRLREERLNLPNVEREEPYLPNFVAANLDRTRLAGESQVLQLVWALEKTKSEDIPERTIEIAKRRIANPALSLRDLAHSFDDPLVTKDVVAGTIRRLLSKASAVSGESPPFSKPL